MYKKNKAKQATCRTPDGCEKQLDNILVNRRYRQFSKDAEANDMRHMRSDHRCVMAHFVIPAQNKTYSHFQMNGSDKKQGVMDKTKQAINDTTHEESSWFEKERQQQQRTNNMQRKKRHVKK